MNSDVASVSPISLEARIAGRLSVGFMLDLCDLGRMDEPVLDALLVAAIVEANVNRLNRLPDLQSAHATLDSAPPDDLRRPVSINALAASLRLPFETVRRHVNHLVGRGVVASGPGGVHVPTTVVTSALFIHAARARYERVFSFYAELRASHVVEALPTPPLPVEHPAAPVRAVGRILSDYFFRTLDVLQQQTRDPLTGLVLMDVIHRSSEHVAPLQAAAAMQQGWLSDVERTPVRVVQISRRLGIPYETTRRHVGWLVDQGFCRRAGAGVLPSADYLASPAMQANAVDNLSNLRRMYRQIGMLDVSAAVGAVQALSPSGA